MHEARVVLHAADEPRESVQDEPGGSVQDEPGGSVQDEPRGSVQDTGRLKGQSSQQGQRTPGPDSPAHVHLQGRLGAGRHDPGGHSEHHGVGEDGGLGEILQVETGGEADWPRGPTPGWVKDYRGLKQAASSLVSGEAAVGGQDPPRRGHPPLLGREAVAHPVCPGRPYLVGVVQQGDVEGDEPREAGVGEGQALHEEALLIAVEAVHLVGHLVLAEHVPVRLAGVPGAWRGQRGLARGPGAGGITQPPQHDGNHTTTPASHLPLAEDREAHTRVRAGLGGAGRRSFLRWRSDLSEGNSVASSKAMFTPKQQVPV